MIKFIHLDETLARLAQQFRNKANVESLLAMSSVQSQAIEDAAWDVLQLRSLDTATGSQLDLIGRIVGLGRNALGTSDEDYRLQLKAKIKLNNSSGTIEELIEIFGLVLTNEILTVSESYPAEFLLQISGTFITSAQATILLSFLTSGKAGGVRAVMEWYESDPTLMFQFDDGPGFDQGRLAGAAEA